MMLLMVPWPLASSTFSETMFDAPGAMPRFSPFES